MTDMARLVEAFQSEDRCRQYLAELRWPEGVRCLKCGGSQVYRVHTRNRYECADKSCRHQFSVTAGTIFHDSHLPLWKWMLATYLMCESKKGMSANQLKRTLKVSYKTSWYLCHRIRAAMHDAPALPLQGTVEIDETYIGGKRRGVGRGNYRDYKTAGIGAVQRGGGVRLKVIHRVSQKAAKRFINAATQPTADTIYTDEAPFYEAAIPKGVTHDAVNHSENEGVRADVHTNNVESIWSLLKRSIVGSYHQVSTKHLPRYLDEIAFKHNKRHSAYLFRDTILRLIGAQAMPFRALVDQ